MQELRCSLTRLRQSAVELNRQATRLDELERTALPQGWLPEAAADPPGDALRSSRQPALRSSRRGHASEAQDGGARRQRERRRSSQDGARHSAGSGVAACRKLRPPEPGSAGGGAAGFTGSSSGGGASARTASHSSGRAKGEGEEATPLPWYERDHPAPSGPLEQMLPEAGGQTYRPLFHRKLQKPQAGEEEASGPWLVRSALLPGPDPSECERLRGIGLVDVPRAVAGALLQLQAPHDWSVVVETCHHCSEHAMHTRHDPRAYAGAFRRCVCEAVRLASEAAGMVVRPVVVLRLPTPDLHARKGGFEVFLLPPQASVSKAVVLLSSKLTTQSWPKMSGLVSKLGRLLPSEP